MDTPIRGQPPYIQWTNCLPPAINCPYVSTSEKGQPSNNGQNARPQRVHYSECISTNHSHYDVINIL